MGQAVIDTVVGLGLYKIKLTYNLAPLEKELTELKKQADEFDALLETAQDTAATLLQGRDDARDGLDAVVEQWKQALEDAASELAPILPPPNSSPSVGDDAEAELATALFDAINEKRGTAPALNRESTLDSAIKTLLYTLAPSGRSSDTHLTAVDRVRQAGYDCDQGVGAQTVVTFGASSVEAAVATMLKNIRNKEAIENEDFTVGGAAYLYWKNNPYTYFWGVILAAPNPDPDPVPAPFDPSTKKDPADDAAKKSSDELKKIEVPKLDDFQPEQLGEASAAYGKAVAEYNAAQDAVDKLNADKEARDKRIAVLEKIKTVVATPIHAWACQQLPEYAVGATVSTAEAPGWYDKLGRPTSVMMGDPPTAYNYDEYDVNVLPQANTTGQLRNAEIMSDALIFVNIALEPGHFKWKPLWRYGTLTAQTEATFTVELPLLNARTMLSFGADMALDANHTLTSVPNLGCGPLSVGDDVLVQFTGHNRDTPTILGKRREPRACEEGRIGWQEIVNTG